MNGFNLHGPQGLIKHENLIQLQLRETAVVLRIATTNSDREVARFEIAAARGIPRDTQIFLCSIARSTRTYATKGGHLRCRHLQKYSFLQFMLATQFITLTTKFTADKFLQRRVGSASLIGVSDSRADNPNIITASTFPIGAVVAFTRKDRDICDLVSLS